MNASSLFAKENFYHAIFMEKLKANSCVLKQEKYLSLIDDVKRIKNTNIKKCSKDYRILKRYDVLSIQGSEKLIKPLSAENEEVKLFVFVEELFDILYSAHLSIGHGGRDRMIKELKKRYTNISQFQITTFLNLCESCQKKKSCEKKGIVVKPMIFSNFNSRCQVDLIDYQSQPDENYKFLLVYQDHLTKFVVLKPLTSKRAEEVAYNILDIFLLIGAPVILQSDNGREFCNAIIENLKSMWPELKIIHGKPRHSQSQGSVERANQDVENMLTTWMADNSTNKWSEGARFVQMMKNRAYHSGIRRSPYEAMFGCSARIGLSSSFIPHEVQETINTEEDLQNICPQSQNISENESQNIEQSETQTFNNKFICIVCSEETTGAHTCKNCNMNVHIICGVSQNDEGYGKKILCTICSNKLNQEKQRAGAIAGLEIQAKKMQMLCDSKHPKVEKGCTVRVKVPDVDRAKTDSRVILAVILYVTDDGFYKLGTKSGILKQLYSRSQFSPCKEKFINIDEIPQDEISLRQAATSQSFGTGQGYLKCNCNSKCSTRMCTCRKNNLLCNSKCHKSLNCANK